MKVENIKINKVVSLVMGNVFVFAGAVLIPKGWHHFHYQLNGYRFACEGIISILFGVFLIQGNKIVFTFLSIAFGAYYIFITIACYNDETLLRKILIDSFDLFLLFPLFSMLIENFSKNAVWKNIWYGVVLFVWGCSVVSYFIFVRQERH